ncbi:YIP1 family protein [Ancylomarina sp. DW003]|nr:Yip1 family protein [Ancylomarina sp. DW003]MDE5421331.1 YIP1 family protein [Ancylomarina sp. DW003]
MINIDHLFSRIKLVTLNPQSAWEEIKNEPRATKDLILNYMLPLVLIPTIASFIGYGLIGSNTYFRSSSINWGLNQAILAFIGAFLGVFISAWCIHKLAPSFNTQTSIGKATSLVVYAYTPSWLAGVFYLIPSLSILGLVAGIYSLYILYLGFKSITNVPEEKKTNFFVISLISIIGVSFILSLVLGALLVSIGLVY